MHVVRAGAGEPLLMLLGRPQHWYEFRHLIPALSTRYHIICPDLRGFGSSQAPPSGYEKAQLVRDCWACSTRSRSTPERMLAYMALGGAHLWPSVGPEPVPMIAGRYRPERLAPPVPFLHGVEDGCIDPVLARPAQQCARHDGRVGAGRRSFRARGSARDRHLPGARVLR